MASRVTRRFVLGALVPVLLLAIAAPSEAAAASVSQPNNWFGLSGPPGTSMAAWCALGGTVGADVASGVWVAVGGHRYLDIVQVGAIATPGGRRFFAAWGRGTPFAPGSLYVQRDLGRADARDHAFAIALRHGVWSLSIDGRTVLTVADTFRDWPVVATEAMAESEGAGDLLGGTVSDPTRCRAQRGGPWTIRATGRQALGVASRITASSFALWRRSGPSR